LAATLFAAAPASSQTQDNRPESIRPVPVLTGGVGVVPTFSGGQFTLVNVVAPVVLVSLGDKFLIESRGTLEGDYTRQPNGSFGGMVAKEVDYLQLDYIANRYVTVSVGRFLTPFGIYNERLYPVWVKNLQNEPLILPITEGAGTGAMVRGGFAVASDVTLNYAAYFSAASTVTRFESDRGVGVRFGVFLPHERVEIGASIQHRLQDERSNRCGMHFEWQPRSHPLDVRAEFLDSNQGRGYWVEPAYKLSGRLRHLQVVARVQQFFVKPGVVVSDEAPEFNTHVVEGGMNYFLKDGLRLTASYGRELSPDGNANLWTMGLTYRFAFPLGHGGVR
jgi:hypothetical protein